MPSRIGGDSQNWRHNLRYLGAGSSAAERASAAGSAHTRKRCKALHHAPVQRVLFRPRDVAGDQGGNQRVADHGDVLLLSVQLRSAPAVMMPELSDAFGLSARGMASMVGLFYYGYSPFSLVAGAAMDRLGPRRVVPLGAATVGVGALLFATGNTELARRPFSAGRRRRVRAGRRRLHRDDELPRLARRDADRRDPDVRHGRRLAGQFVVGPLIAAGVTWTAFWGGMGILGLAISLVLFLLLPESAAEPARRLAGGSPHRLRVVFRDPQSILCGMIAGLLFIPTTIFDMIWGVRFLQDARGLDYATAVMRSAMVPLGWIIGCPLLGFSRIASAGAKRSSCGRGRPVRVPGVDPVRARRSVSALRRRSCRRHRQRRGDAAVHDHQGSQPARASAAPRPGSSTS